MSRIRGKGNKSTELKLVAAFKAARVTGWRRHVRLKPWALQDDSDSHRRPHRLKVEPDFIFRPQKIAVYVDGCFWHGCPLHGTKPKNDAETWRRKLEGNAMRDKRATRALEAADWEVMRIWEHELTEIEVVVTRIKKRLAARGRRVARSRKPDAI